MAGRAPPGQVPRAVRAPAPRPLARLGPGGLVLTLALLARLLLLLDARDAPFWTTPLVDERLHLHLATRIVDGLPPPNGAWYVSPGYAHLLAAVLAAGGGVLQVKLLQMAMGVLSCWLIFGLGRRWFGSLAGAVAGCLWAVLPSALLHEILLLNATAAVLALLVALALMTGPRPWRWGLAGLALGAASVLRGELALAGGLAIAGSVLAWRRGWPGAPRSWLGPALLAAGLAAVVAVPTIQNARRGGGFVGVAYGGGPNFYIGNSPSADGSYIALRPDRMDVFFEERDAIELAGEAIGREPTAADVSRHWLGKGLRWWADDPPGAIRLTLKKALLAWGWWEGADVISPEVAGRWALPLRLPAPRSGLLLAPALVGLWLARRRRELWPLWAVGLGLWLGLAFFFVFERFRLPLVAVTLPLGGYALSSAVSAWRCGRRERVVLGVVATAALSALLAIPSVGREKEALRANVGALLLEQGRPTEALREFDAVHVAAPWAERIHISMASAHASLGHRQLALRDLAEALRFLYEEGERLGRISTEDALYCHELAGDIMTAMGEGEAARANYEAALRLPGVEGQERRRVEGKMGMTGVPPDRGRESRPAP